ncbi:MAG: alkaline phosphatase family protein [Bacteroidota bacterium]|nr:alkaline phosphatase family protein [Candidatus Kapabacteria bacterium]MDW8219463.1 alkaline phosphatase family protein [Bacteroidota bacterium]
MQRSIALWCVVVCTVCIELGYIAHTHEARAQSIRRGKTTPQNNNKRITDVTPQGFLQRTIRAPVATQGTLRPDAPKLIVIMSFDQMRGDYPRRWGHLWSQQGFNRIIRQGAYFPECYFNHASNITAPGHSVHLTGVYPWKSGIVGNDFYDRLAGRKLYCVQDTVHKTFGISNPEEWCSPANLQVPTLGDYLKTLSPKSRVVGISQKDRAAILMAGHNADAAYWFEFEAGGYTTSEYYVQEFPAWLKRWNEQNDFRTYSGKVWNAEISDEYALPDTARWEGNFGRMRNIFPHTVSDMHTSATLSAYTSNFMVMPQAVEHFFKFAKAVFKEEHLARDTIPDILCLSISSTDYCGHAFGPDSRELQELYVHVDRMLADWIDFLDEHVGRKNYTLVITSDHGVAPVPEYVRHTVPGADAGRLKALDVIEAIDTYMRQTFPVGAAMKWVEFYEPPSLFLNPEAIRLVTTTPFGTRHSLPTSVEVLDSLAAFLLRMPGVGIVLTKQQLEDNRCPEYLSAWQFALVRHDFFAQRTGDIVFYPAKFWITGSVTATHGTPHDYDRHVPLMLMGAGVKPGYYRDAKVSPADIAPSLAQILGIVMARLDGTVLPWK